MNKKLLFFIVEPDGRVRQEVNGVIQSLNVKTPLRNAPDGHKEIALLRERSLTRYGIGRNFSLPFGFVLDGYKITKHDFYNFGVDRELYLVIKRFVNKINATYYEEYYKHFYKGQLDFSSFVNKKQEYKSELTVMEGGAAKLLKAFEGTLSEYGFDVDGWVYIMHDGLELSKTGKFIIADGVEIDYVTFGYSWLAPASFIKSEGESFGIAFATQTLEETSSNNIEVWMPGSENWMAKNSPDSIATITVNVKGKITYTCIDRVASNVSFRMRLYRSNQTLANQALYELFFESPQEGQTYSHDIDIDIPLTPGEKLFLHGSINMVAGTNLKIAFLEGSELKVSYKDKYKTTYSKAFKPYDLYKNICKKAGVQENKIQSEILKQSSVFITCGDSLREIANSFVKTNFNDFFKAFDVYESLGYAIENGVAIIENRERFFDKSNPVDLGEVVLEEDAPFTEWMYNSIKIGHAEQDIDDVNGKYDFNGWQIYSLPIKAIGDKQLDLQSPYTASPYELEKTRINFEGKDTTDGNADNKVFAVDVDLTNKQDEEQVLLSFVSSGGYIVFPSTLKMVKGQKFRISNTVNYNLIFEVVSVDDNFISTQNVYVNQPITVPEITVMATLTWINGQVFNYKRAEIPDSGVPYPDSIFNVSLRPSKLLDKHLTWIKSWLHNYLSEKIKFESNNRNKDLIVDGVKDNRDRNIADIPMAVFKAHYFNVKTITPVDLPEIYEVTPNKSYLFSVNGKQFGGFVLNDGCSPYDSKPQEFKLLSWPENDLKQLI